MLGEENSIPLSENGYDLLASHLPHVDQSQLHAELISDARNFSIQVEDRSLHFAKNKTTGLYDLEIEVNGEIEKRPLLFSEDPGRRKMHRLELDVEDRHYSVVTLELSPSSHEAMAYVVPSDTAESNPAFLNGEEETDLEAIFSIFSSETELFRKIILFNVYFFQRISTDEYADDMHQRMSDLLPIWKGLVQHPSRINFENMRLMDARRVEKGFGSDYAKLIVHDSFNLLGNACRFADFVSDGIQEGLEDDIDMEAIQGDISAIESGLFDEDLTYFLYAFKHLHEKPEHKPTPQSLNNLVRSSAKKVASKATEKGLTIGYSLDATNDLKKIQIDRVQFSRVIMNIISNGLRHTSEGGVNISSQIEDNEFVVSIADTGSGIPSELLPSIFKKGVQGSEGNTGMSGLGLAIVKEIVEAHGGEITVESFHERRHFYADSDGNFLNENGMEGELTLEQNGTTFHIRIPIATS